MEYYESVLAYQTKQIKEEFTPNFLPPEKYSYGDKEANNLLFMTEEQLIKKKFLTVE